MRGPEEKIVDAFKTSPRLVLGDRRTRWQKMWDRMPWSWYSRKSRKWVRDYRGSR